MKIVFLSFFLIVFCVHAQEVHYKNLKLVSMSSSLQKHIGQIFKEHDFKRVLVGKKGSSVTGINMLFTDRFFSSQIFFKFNIQGDFELNRLYQVNDMFVVHINLAGVSSAIMFKNFDRPKIKKILPLFSALSKKTTLLIKVTDQIFPSAHAEDCFDPSISNAPDIDMGVALQTASTYLGSCLENMGSGLKEDAGGYLDTITSFGRGLKNEFQRLTTAPLQRMGEYWTTVESGFDGVVNFLGSVVGAILDPAKGYQILTDKFGELGANFSQLLESINTLEFKDQIDIVCKTIGELGIDVLLVAITAGAATGKLGLRAQKIFFKVIKIGKVLGAGILLPFKTLYNLSKTMMNRIKSLQDSGYGDLLNRRLEETCPTARNDE